MTGCGVTLLPGAIDPACQGRPDATDCQAALEVARPELGSDLDGYELTISPITCNVEGRTTWVESIPDPEGECLPSGGVELGRTPTGPWTVVSLTHGAPPCAFEDV
ncbi:MAG: hypothetical protein ABIW50_06065 [Candidatus Limnocylindria bacterium]